MSRRMEKLAQRLKDDPLFLASALAEYARSEDLDDAALAAVLRCSVETLAGLRLCLRPRPERFAEDIDEIASHFGVGDERLAEAVRRADALAAMRGRTRDARSEGFLMAARDREPEERPT